MIRERYNIPEFLKRLWLRRVKVKLNRMLVLVRCDEPYVWRR